MIFYSEENIIFIEVRLRNLMTYVFNTFTAKGFSETSPDIHLNKHIFQSQ